MNTYNVTVLSYSSGTPTAVVVKINAMVVQVNAAGALCFYEDGNPSSSPAHVLNANYWLKYDLIQG